MHTSHSGTGDFKLELHRPIVAIPCVSVPYPYETGERVVEKEHALGEPNQFDHSNWSHCLRVGLDFVGMLTTDLEFLKKTPSCPSEGSHLQARRGHPSLHPSLARPSSNSHSDKRWVILCSETSRGLTKNRQRRVSTAFSWIPSPISKSFTQKSKGP